MESPTIVGQLPSAGKLIGIICPITDERENRNTAITNIILRMLWQTIRLFFRFRPQRYYLFMKYTIFQPKKPIFLLHICSKSSTFAGLFAKGHFSSLPIVLSFSSLPLPPVLFLPVVWQVFRLLSRPRRFAGSPRNLDFWGAFPREHIHAFTPYTLHFFYISSSRHDLPSGLGSLLP